ncbi:MAG: hypothetical protein ABIP54_01415, partial [Candidatus Andersenbacteria bacterium]
FHEMPVLSELVRSSSRIRSVFFLVFGMLVAWSVSELSRRFFKKALLRNAFVIIVTLFIFIDLFTLYAPLFKDLFNQPLPSVSQNNQFRRISHGYTNDQSEYWHASYVSYLNNEGTNDLCNPTMMTTHSTFTAAVDDLDPQRPYQGEGYLAQTKDGVTDIAITPNKITATFTSPKQDTLVLNQNYFPGWRTVPAREVYNYKGLLAARIGPNDSRLTFVYSPFSYHAGKYITILALLLALVVIIKPFLRRTV